MMLDLAERVATEAHDGQFRANGESYISHPKRVAESLAEMGSVFQAVGWLHDTIEDTDVTEDMLRDFGFPSAVVRAVVGLSRKRDEKYTDFIERCGMTRLTRTVKIADIQDNLRDVDTYKPGLRRRYEKALRYLTNLTEF